MDRIREIEVFLAIVDTQSLAAAGRKLGLSAPAVTRALARLEDRLGEALILRSTRSLSLTAAGNAFAHHARDVVNALSTAEAAVGEASSRLRGTMVITAPLLFGRLVVAPALAAFLHRHGEVRARLILLDRVAHFLEEGIDLGVRIGHLPDANHKARRIGSVRQRLVASPTYLSAHGQPETPQELSDHWLVGFMGRLPTGQLQLSGGRSVPFEPMRLEVDCAATALALVEAGEGIASLYSYQCADSVRAGRVVPLFDDQMPDPVPVQFVWPERRYTNTLTRAFVDESSERLSSILRGFATAEAGPPEISAGQVRSS